MFQSGSANPTRIAIFGDQGGQFIAFMHGLADLGVDWRTLKVPDDLVLILAGDLIHKGPFSDLMIAVADALHRNNPEKVHVIIGNNEGQYLGGHKWMPNENEPWVPRISEASMCTLVRWLHDGTAKLAVAIKTREHSNLLVTHGGLTPKRHQAMGADLDYFSIAEELNALLPDNIDEAFRTGIMWPELGSDDPSVTWAVAHSEVYPQWFEVFNQGLPVIKQVHGHSNIYNPRTGDLRVQLPAAIHIHHFKASNHVRIDFGGIPMFWAVDQTYKEEVVTKPSVPLVLTGHVLNKSVIQEVKTGAYL